MNDGERWWAQVFQFLGTTKTSFGESFVNNLKLGSEVKIVVLAQVHYLTLQWIHINELDMHFTAALLLSAAFLPIKY